jgi:hypothetical protein
MRNIKLYESFRTEQEIIDLCSEYGIENYQIRDDGSIDVDGSVYLHGKLGDLKQLPLTFNQVKGDFNCGGNNLTTLEGCPKKVGGYFDCGRNKLTTLEGCSEVVRGSFICNSNKLTSLEYSPKIAKSLICWSNENLTSLEGLENTYIDDELSVINCSRLYSLKGFPKKVGVFYCGNTLYCGNTPIKPIYDTFIQEYDYDTMRKFNKFDVIYTDGLYWFIDYDNLGKFLRSVGKEDLMMSKEDFDDFIQTTKYKWDY